LKIRSLRINILLIQGNQINIKIIRLKLENESVELISSKELSKLLKLNNKHFKVLTRYIIKVTKLDKINLLYKNTSEKVEMNFADSLLEKLNLKYEVCEEDLNNIPQSGAVFTISNHPYGGLDGLILLSILQKRRSDFKIIANYFLNKVPELSESFIPVNPFQKNAADELNITGIKKILSHINNQGAVGLFPSGEVSSFQSSSMRIEDCSWSKAAGKMLMKTGVPVVPIYFSGANGVLFNFLGMIHPFLRTLRLPAELLNKKNSTIKIRIGKAISPERLKEFENANQMMRYLRAKTYSLGSALDVNDFFNNKTSIKEDIIDPIGISSIKSDLKLIIGNDLLMSVSNYDIFICEAETIPNILKEIGRLREITFRENGEGTNKSADLDEFDLYYRHLFVWDRNAEKIAGAYRIGIGKEIYKKYKTKGFYLNKLFKIKKEFKDILISSFEMGRAFVSVEYQKKHIVLFLLWKGILCYLKKAGNENVKFLIGPVSISNNYSQFSKDILIKYIMKEHHCKELARFIKPRKKFRADVNKEDMEILLDAEGKDFKLIDKLISEIEISNNKTPVLLKKYLKQNAKILGFNVDSEFNNSIDGFLILNLDNLPEETIPMLEK